MPFDGRAYSENIELPSWCWYRCLSYYFQRMNTANPAYRALVVQMVLPLGLVQKWKVLTLVRTGMVLINCTSFDALYPFNRATIFRRDVVWAKYKTLVVTKISSHCLVIFIPALQPCHCRSTYRGFTFKHIVMMLMVPMMMVMC